jgi:hypothetical protein
MQRRDRSPYMATQDSPSARACWRTPIRNTWATVFFLGSLLAGSLMTTSPARGQTAPQPADKQDPQQHPAEDTKTQPSAANQSRQNSSQPGRTVREQQNIQREQQTGTSKDRIFWALPNFLTVENADNVPPLTAGQKFKVVGRSLIDPSEFVLIGFVAGLGQASNSDSSYGQGAQVTPRDTGPLTGTTPLRISSRARPFLRCFIRIRATTNWVVAGS